MSLESRLRVLIGGDSLGAEKAFRSVQKEAKNTSKSFDSARSSSSSFWSDVGKGAAVGGGLAVAALTSAVGASIQYQSSLDQLQTSLKNANISYAANAGTINDVINANIQLGTNEDDTIAALNQGVISTGSLTKAMSLLQTAQNVAAAENKPLADSMMAVIKASEGQLRPLKQLGLDLPVAAGGAEKQKVAYEGLLKAQQDLTNAEASANAQSSNVTQKNARAIYDAKQKLLFLEQQDAQSKTHTIAQTQALVLTQEALKNAEDNTSTASAAADTKIATAKDKVVAAEGKLKDVTTTGATIIAAVNAKTADAAVAHSKTLQGQIEVDRAKVDKLKRELGDKVITFMARDAIPALQLLGQGELNFAHDFKNDVIDPLIVAWTEADHLYDSLTQALGLTAKTHDDSAAIYAANDAKMGWKPGTTAALAAKDAAHAQQLKQAPEGLMGGPVVVGRGSETPSQALHDYLAGLAAQLPTYGNSGGHRPGPPAPIIVNNFHAQPTPAMLNASNARHIQRNGPRANGVYTAVAP